MKLLFVKGSPRGGSSLSGKIAEASLSAYRGKYPSATIDGIDLWQTPLPEFDGDRAAAKLAVFAKSTLEGVQKTAWDEIVAITQRFTTADDFLFTVPMWNGGIPYRLKLYIDIITQPGMLFEFTPGIGCRGLMEGKKATVIYTSGVYAPGAPPEFGADYHSTYFDNWLRLIGFQNIASVRFQPSLLTNDVAGGLERARLDAAKAGAR